MRQFFRLRARTNRLRKAEVQRSDIKPQAEDGALMRG